MTTRDPFEQEIVKSAVIAWTDPPDTVSINATAIRVDPDELLTAIEYNSLILAQLALSANREARFNDRDALREALTAMRDQTKEILSAFNLLEGGR